MYCMCQDPRRLRDADILNMVVGGSKNTNATMHPHWAPTLIGQWRSEYQAHGYQSSWIDREKISRVADDGDNEEDVRDNEQYVYYEDDEDGEEDEIIII